MGSTEGFWNWGGVPFLIEGLVFALQVLSLSGAETLSLQTCLPEGAGGLEWSWRHVGVGKGVAS